MKKILIFLMLVTALVVLVKKFNPHTPVQPDPPSVSPKEFTFEDAKDSINENDCKSIIDFLASDELEGRMSGKKGNIKAAEYIKQKLEKYGLKTMYHKFKINRANAGPNNEQGDDWTQNVYAWIDGSEFKNEILVVGAHFDHVGYGPKYSRSNKTAIHNGADDNASGTVVVMEIAEAMSKLHPKRTVVFQFYSGEEMGLLGSRFYCDNPVFPQESPDIKNHIAMINLDMVGHLKDQPNLVKDFIFDLREEVKELNSKYPFALKVIGSGGGSDHVPFNNKGVPNLFIHTGTHKYYHTPEDDVDTVNIKGISQIAQFAFELTWTIANSDKKIQKALIKELPTEKDHDQIKFY